MMKRFILAALILASCTRAPQIRPEHGLYHQLVPRLSDRERKAEIFWMEPKAKKPWPTVIYLHGNQERAKTDKPCFPPGLKVAPGQKGPEIRPREPKVGYGVLCFGALQAT